MQNFIKTIMNALKSWTKKAIKDSAADWNQNDEAAPDYVKNRPFYEERVLEAVIEGATYNCDTDPGNGNYWKRVGISYGDPFKISPNTKYTVVFDGVEYVCNSVESPYGAGLGNMALALGTNPPNFGYNNDMVPKDDTGEPFGLFYGSYDSTTLSVYAEEAGNHMVSVYIDNTTIHKIDSKYLPIDYFVVKVLDFNPELMSGTADKTPAEIIEAIEAGKTVAFLFDGMVCNFTGSNDNEARFQQVMLDVNGSSLEFIIIDVWVHKDRTFSIEFVQKKVQSVSEEA